MVVVAQVVFEVEKVIVVVEQVVGDHRKVGVVVDHSSNHHHLRELEEVPGCLGQCLHHSPLMVSVALVVEQLQERQQSLELCEAGPQDHLVVDLELEWQNGHASPQNFELLVHILVQVLLEELCGLQSAHPHLQSAVAHLSLAPRWIRNEANSFLVDHLQLASHQSQQVGLVHEVHSQ